MNDSEFIYSLYVQANPVPEPELLPVTKDEAVLLTLERSPDMITEERTEKREPPKPPSRKRLVSAFGVAAILIVVVVAAAIMVSGESGPVAAADADPVVVFDGTECSYEGPTSIEQGEVEFSLTNSGTEPFSLFGWRVRGEVIQYELERTPIGTGMNIADEPFPEGDMMLGWPVAAGASSTHTSFMPSGTYMLDCVFGDGDRVWRPAQIEVVAP